MALAVVVLLAGMIGLSLAPPAFAQADEIQVYDGGLAGTGVFNLTWHNNFTPRGLKMPAFPGGTTPDHSFNGVTEWAFGVTDWFEAGLYLPLYTRDTQHGFGIDGGKLRALVATPNGSSRRFAFGLGFELGLNAHRWDQNRFSSEFRPILAWHVNPHLDLIANPIVDTAYDGVGKLVFAPSTRVAYNASPTWALAIETYSEFGELRGFNAVPDQSQQIYAVVDHVTRNGFELEFGAGWGLTRATDAFTLKLIVARDLGRLRRKP